MKATGSKSVRHKNELIKGLQLAALYFTCTSTYLAYCIYVCAYVWSSYCF